MLGPLGRLSRCGSNTSERMRTRLKFFNQRPTGTWCLVSARTSSFYSCNNFVLDPLNGNSSFLDCKLIAMKTSTSIQSTSIILLKTSRKARLLLDNCHGLICSAPGQILFMSLGRSLHQIWLGPNKMPADQWKWTKQWARMCRADRIEYKLWRDADVQADAISFSMINRSALDAATTMAQKADILRLEILYQFGGIYLDTDVEPVKSIAPLYWFSSSMLVCHENDK